MQSLVRTIDITPTILDLLGLSPLPSLDGESLRPFLSDPAVDEAANLPKRRNLIASAHFGFADFLMKQNARAFPLYAIRANDYKIVLRTRRSGAVVEERYDLMRDPKELNPDGLIEPVRYEALRNELEEFISAAAIRDASSVIPMDVETWEKLRALGYLDNE